MSSEHSAASYALHPTHQRLASSSTGHSSRASSRPNSRLSQRSPDSNEDLQLADSDEVDNEDGHDARLGNGHVRESHSGSSSLLLPVQHLFRALLR